MVIARKIAYNVVVNSVSKVLATVLALVSIGFITRYLGAEGFGNYATVLAFLSFFAAFSDLGLYQISTREISRTGADEKKIIGNVFSLRVAASLAMLICAPLIVYFFDYPTEVKRGILIVAVSFLFSSTYQLLNGVFQKRLVMDKVSFAELTGKAIQVVAVVVAIKLNLGFDWIIGALLLNMLANFAIVLLWSRKYLRFAPRFDTGYWKDFLKESLPMGGAAIITFLYFKMDTILLSVMKSASDVGIYNAAYKVLENITFFPAMIAGLVLPLMAKNIFEDRKRFEEIADKTFKVFLALTIPLVVGVLFLSDGIINLIGGVGFAEAGDVLRILVFALALIFFGHFFNAIIIVGNLQKKLMIVLACAATLNILLNLMLIPRFSYLAAAYVSVLTEATVVALGLFLTRKNLGYSPRFEKFFNMLAAGILMGAFLWISDGASIFIRAITAVTIYLGGLWLFRAIKAEEIISLISKKGVVEYEEIA